jgi:hypothetical protein
LRSTHGCCAFNPTSGTAAPKTSLFFARTDEALGGPEEGQICMSEERGAECFFVKKAFYRRRRCGWGWQTGGHCGERRDGLGRARAHA